ncbi:beta-fructofuranosidase [Nakamurella sp. UYEF19]|uniref:glycosyl hydrolase family 32 n=1 Tax=Nakamurella sp. UYEF19 TaxID=1756392 RepID=UPI00339ADA42
MFSLPEAWVWDFWLADDGQHYHLFFLHASRALPKPHDRHYRASIGHAISTDLTRWTRVQDALVRSDATAFDDLATWTGSVVRHPDGTWFMFYTGASLTPAGNRQQIGYATSSDLLHWRKSGANPVLSADPRWYEVLADGKWHDEAFRDPWVVADPDGDGWHMLITARANEGAADDRGVVGHAWSPDLRTWELRPPLTEPGQGFGQLEVTQVEIVDGRPILLFSCLDGDLSKDRGSDGTSGGVWWAGADSLLGPYDIAGARQLTGRSLYSGRIIWNRDSSEWKFLAFHHDAADGSFVGVISDPQPISWTGQTLALGRTDAGISR